MRAWCIEDQQLQLDTLPDLQPGPEEICVQVKAIGVNRADLLQVLGRYPAPPGTDSRIPGLEYAG
ncbi:MAG: NAD(P)H-quinone oxidoreductase, partial [Alcanivorax sp.]